MTEVEGLQAALAAEHAAAYGYGVVGANLGGDAQRSATAAYTAHLARRDALTAILVERGATPAAAAPAYALPGPVESATAARRLAATIEDRVAATYADLVAAGTGEVRALASSALQEAAVRAASWRRASAGPFPGLPERA
jgi:hypothetical protein